jgi:hypothetical protein
MHFSGAVLMARTHHSQRRSARFGRTITLSSREDSRRNPELRWKKLAKHHPSCSSSFKKSQSSLLQPMMLMAVNDGS